MSRAPLLRTPPALGSSSYGAVRIPQDESDDNGDDESEVAPRKDKTGHEWPFERWITTAATVIQVHAIKFFWSAEE
jgi:hypothetical protein